jgi:hypothetical protein
LGSITIAPAIPARDGKEVILTVTARPEVGAGRKHLPPWIVVTVNGKDVRLVDDGSGPDAVASDGVYTIAGRLIGDETLTRPTSVRLVDGRSVADTHSRIDCRIRTVPCRPGCRSIIFREPCIICFEVDCRIVWR